MCGIIEVPQWSLQLSLNSHPVEFFLCMRLQSCCMDLQQQPLNLHSVPILYLHLTGPNLLPALVQEGRLFMSLLLPLKSASPFVQSCTSSFHFLCVAMFPQCLLSLSCVCFINKLERTGQCKMEDDRYMIISVFVFVLCSFSVGLKEKNIKKKKKKKNTSVNLCLVSKLFTYTTSCFEGSSTHELQLLHPFAKKIKIAIEY